jgi:hypothetical protein
MNSTPRLLNRILLGILGLKLLVIGVLLILLAAVPGVAAWWHSWSRSVSDGAATVFEGTQFPGRQGSWLWIVLVLAVVLLIVLMVAWIAQQGKGRTDLLLAAEDPGGVPGDIRIGGGVAEQALKNALADRPDLAGATVSIYDVKGRPALKLRLHPRPGVAPQAVAAEAADLVDALTAVVGQRTPVLVHIAAGARTRFSRAERVR